MGNGFWGIPGGIKYQLFGSTNELPQALCSKEEVDEQEEVGIEERSDDEKVKDRAPRCFPAEESRENEEDSVA